MPNEALIAVLLGALLHASWNAAVKSRADKFLATVFVAIGGSIIAAVVLPFLPQPAPASWPYLAVSEVLQLAYIVVLSLAYRSADMSFVYPLMRGTAPLVVAIAGLFLDETLGTKAWIGIALICGSVLVLSSGAKLRPAILAIGNACIIAAYTLVDARGSRVSGSVVAYTLWLALLLGPPLAIAGFVQHGRALVSKTRESWWIAAGGGIATIGSYGLALWAMQRAPVAATAALRETSIVFGMLIAKTVLKEHVGLRRAALGVLLACGAAILRLQ